MNKKEWGCLVLMLLTVFLLWAFTASYGNIGRPVITKEVPKVPDGALDFLYSDNGADYHCVKKYGSRPPVFSCEMTSLPTPRYNRGYE